MAINDVLLVEGKDDRHVIFALCSHFGLPNCFKIEEAGGVERLLESLPVRLKARRGEGLNFGIVIDADEDPEARWQAVANGVRSGASIDLPGPCESGTVVDMEPAGRFGVWVMPDNRLCGNLEDFLVFLRPRQDIMLPLVDGFLNGLPPACECPGRFEDKDWSKARIHTYLGIQKQPGRPLGLAIMARYLDPHVVATGVFIAWLRRLFID